MACHASFGLDWKMVKCEWSGFVGMAVEAKLVLRGSGAQLAGQESTMWIMTIRTLNESFIHFVVEGLGEIRLGFKMAAVTKAGLRSAQQPCLHLGVVHGMTVNTADVVLDMLRPQEVCVFLSKLMAGETTLG